MGGGNRKSRRGKKKRTFSHISQSEETLIEKEESEINPNPKRTKSKEASNSQKKPSFLEKMRVRLSGGHFRMLNEKLYTCSGSEAFSLFKNDPGLFNVYHAGYQEQMSRWPELPVNIIIKWLKSRNSSLIVADFGCGNAVLSKSVKNKVFSMDLVSNDPSVIACDMSNTPLDSTSVDVAVFCLSLMGTNFHSYLEEANRVLKSCGWLLIAEVRSRFDPSNGGADPEIFVDAMKHLGFNLVSKDGASKAKKIDWPELKPCMYKRR